jgi:hypothetical protein
VCAGLQKPARPPADQPQRKAREQGSDTTAPLPLRPRPPDAVRRATGQRVPAGLRLALRGVCRFARGTDATPAPRSCREHFALQLPQTRSIALHRRSGFCVGYACGSVRAVKPRNSCFRVKIFS